MFALLLVAMVLLYAAVDLSVIAAAFGVIKFSEDLSFRYACILQLVNFQLNLTILLIPFLICAHLSPFAWALSGSHLCLLGAGIWLLMTRDQSL